MAEKTVVGIRLSSFVKSAVETPIFDPILLEIMGRGVQAGFGLVNDYFAMIANPNFFAGTDGNDRTA